MKLVGPPGFAPGPNDLKGRRAAVTLWTHGADVENRTPMCSLATNHVTVTSHLHNKKEPSLATFRSLPRLSEVVCCSWAQLG